MSFRRFLYVVWDVECIDGSCSLRRIDTSRLFFFFRASSSPPPTAAGAGAPLPLPLDSSGGGGAGAIDPSTVHDAGRLPAPAIKICSPILPRLVGETGLLLFKNKGVVAVDRRGTSFMFEEEEEDSPAAALTTTTTIRPLPSLTAPKLSPFSVTVGDSLYVMESNPVPINGGGRHSFEVLTYADHCPIRRVKDWSWRPLAPPPLVDHPDRQCHSVDSYAADAGGSGILVSNHASRRTYRFDTASETWSKVAGDWALPFTGLAEYLPEHGLWFGISSAENDDGCCFCAADVSPPSSLPPVVRGVWKECAEPLPPGWMPALSYAVYLGASRFCVVRFFYTGKVYVCPESQRSYSREEDLHVVITGVEVRGGGSGGDVQVVRHKSERYKVDVRLYYNLL